MVEVRFLESAADALHELMDDPTRADLLVKVDAILDELEVDPGRDRVRRRQFLTKPFGTTWCVEARGRRETYVVLWTMEDDDVPLVVYIGPDF